MKKEKLLIYYGASNNRLTYFKSDSSKEHGRICSSKEMIIKFIHDNELIHDNILNRLYCGSNLSMIKKLPLKVEKTIILFAIGGQLKSNHVMKIMLVGYCYFLKK